MSSHADVFVAGVSLEDPGPSGVGVVLKIDNAEESTYSHALGLSSKEATLCKAVETGLMSAYLVGASTVDIYVPTQRIADILREQVRGNNLWMNALELLSSFDGYVVHPISEDENSLATTLAYKGAETSKVWMDEIRNTEIE